MNASDWLARALGVEEGGSIESVRLSFGAPWASETPGWVFFGCLALSGLAVAFYLRAQPRGGRGIRLALAVCRGLLLCLLFLILADPIREITYTSRPKPLLWILFDGSDSMAIADELTHSERARLDAAVDLPAFRAVTTLSAEAPAATRADYVKALLLKRDDNLLERLEQNFRLKAYLFDRADGVRALEAGKERGDSIDAARLAEQVTTSGQVTALGAALDDLAHRHATSHLAGVLVVSDFDQNAGPPAVLSAARLKVPVFTVGVGARTAADLAIDHLQTDPKMKKAEQSTIAVTLRQQELGGRTVEVRVSARPIGEEPDATSGEPFDVGRKQVTLERSIETLQFPFTPEQTGRFAFVAEVEPVAGEVNLENNRAEREATVIDDFLRLLFVEHEPTWEWRFLKEVFHRDPLVGLRGFRTFLRSSDPAVREGNELFVTNLTPPRSEFFQYDVIFLGDYPGAQLSTRFCEMTKEFVGQFGGGLVVIAGPRFGPGELADTPLADMLPVVVDRDARPRDDREFALALTPMAGQFDFMRLGQSDDENRRAWQNLGPLAWYQPVRRVESTATTVLAEHPTDMCLDGTTRQPLIAIRKYGRGEVVYIAFNETWRLRRRYGERYYRQFWGQLIHRLGLSHALGRQKRFVVRTDREQYQPDETVLLSAEAYDENFERLSGDDLPDRAIRAELIRPVDTLDGAANATAVGLTQSRPGIFESRIPVFEPGEYRATVTDPITSEVSEVNFRVASVSAERRSVVRNYSEQQRIAAETGGRSYELDTIGQLLDDFSPPRLTEQTVEIEPLWSSWLWFGTVIGLMLGEWFVRKRINLT
jgi:hypothetical protein